MKTIWRRIRKAQAVRPAPDILDQMSWDGRPADNLPAEQRSELEAARWLLERRKALELRPGFVAASWRRLAARIGPEGSQPDRRLAVRDWIQPRMRFKQVFLTVMLVLVLSANTRSLRAAAKASFPGDVFYPVKLIHEEAQLVFTLTERGDARLHTRFAQRRLAETAALILEGRHEEIQSTAETFAWQVQQAASAVQQVAFDDPVNAAELAEDLDERVFKQTEVLTWLRGAVSPESQIEIDRVLIEVDQNRIALDWLLP